MPDVKPLPKRIMDGLYNAITGAGTTVDRKSFNRWSMPVVVAEQIEAAYRSSWLMRKIVDLPPFDMTREWRDWQAKGSKIEDIEAEEKRLKVQDKVLKALQFARLGGGALIMGVSEGQAATPLNLEALTNDCLEYLHVVPYTVLNVGEVEDDPDSPQFGEPKNFELRRRGTAHPVPIHGSRVITFKGVTAGAISNSTPDQAFWGDSVVIGLDGPVQNATTAMDEFATLIAEAKIDIFGIPKLLQNVGSSEYEAKLMRRLEIANISKSLHRSLLKDSEETWEVRQMNWAGMPEIIQTYLAVAAGAADIPATRLLGKAPDGMNATGESDQSNYFQMIVTKQENELRPALEKLDEVLIRSALGTKPEDLYFEFAPLNVLSEKESAELEKRWAETLKLLSDTQLFLDDALEEAYSNRMIESGLWPGYEDARKKAIKAEEENPTPEDIAGVLPPQPGAPPATVPAPGVAVPTQPRAPAPARS